MKIKTIKKVISNKLEKWANSVEDANIKKIIKENTIVTGGCIASMLLKEPINDFDVYLDSFDSLNAIVRYYQQKHNLDFEILYGKDYQGFDYLTAKNDFEYAESFKVDSGQKARAVSNLDADRIKLFFPDNAVLKIEQEETESEKYLPLFISSNAITLTDSLQIVVRFHGKADEIHKNYDFVHATNYFYNGELFLNQNAMECLLTKELRYIGSKYPITSIIRTKKFILRGFTCSAGEYLKICWQVSELNLQDVTVLEEQLAGVDIAYFDILINALKDRDTSKNDQITYGYISKIIDSIFN